MEHSKFLDIKYTVIIIELQEYNDLIFSVENIILPNNYIVILIII